MTSAELLNPKSEIRNPKYLRRFALALVAITFALVVLGGTVTSKDAGLAVPDWPNTYGYNLFLYPPSLWTGNIFWEHTHRLLASFVGLMCIVMCVWLWVTQRDRRWLRWTGVGLLVLVIAQGVMGGLRVTELSVTWAIVHGVTAQLFLCLTVLIAVAVGREPSPLGRGQGEGRTGEIDHKFATHRSALTPALSQGERGLEWLAIAFFFMLLVQLVLGAAVRHTGAGTAIPDFPSNLGGIVPPFNQAEIETAFDAAAPDEDYSPTAYPTPGQVAVQFAHRVWAVVVLASGLWLIGRVGRSEQSSLRFPALALLFMLAAQIALGVATVWLVDLVNIHTAHQALGAAILATAALLIFRIRLHGGETEREADAVPLLGKAVHA